MRYTITDDVREPGVFIVVNDAHGGTLTLGAEHTGHQAFINSLRELVANYWEEIWREHQVETASGTPVDVVDRRQHLAQMAHGNLVVCAARAIEQELFGT